MHRIYVYVLHSVDCAPILPRHFPARARQAKGKGEGVGETVPAARARVRARASVMALRPT